MTKGKLLLLTSIAVVSLAAVATGITFAAYTAAPKGYTFDGEAESFSVFSIDHYFHGGTGTKDDPYLISNPIEMRNLSKLQAMGAILASSGDSICNHFKLSNSFTWSGVDLSPIAADSDHSWKGVFDGDGKTIHGLSINATGSYAGLFGYVNGGEVKNFILSAPELTTSGTSTAGFAVGTIASGTVTEIGVYGGTSNLKTRAKMVFGGATTSAYAIVGSGSPTKINFLSSVENANLDTPTTYTYTATKASAASLYLWLNGASVSDSN